MAAVRYGGGAGRGISGRGWASTACRGAEPGILLPAAEPRLILDTAHASHGGRPPGSGRKASRRQAGSKGQGVTAAFAAPVPEGIPGSGAPRAPEAITAESVRSRRPPPSGGGNAASERGRRLRGAPECGVLPTRRGVRTPGTRAVARVQTVPRPRNGLRPAAAMAGRSWLAHSEDIGITPLAGPAIDTGRKRAPHPEPGSRPPQPPRLAGVPRQDHVRARSAMKGRRVV